MSLCLKTTHGLVEKVAPMFRETVFGRLVFGRLAAPWRLAVASDCDEVVTQPGYPIDNTAAGKHSGALRARKQLKTPASM